MNIVKQIFNTLDVLYDNKKWGKRIDPDEWNSNFKILEQGHNTLATQLNEQIGEIGQAITAITEDGGNSISVMYDNNVTVMQSVLDKIALDINNRYTKAEHDAVMGSNVNELVTNIDYSPANGTFTITKKNGDVVTIDTVIEKVPASMVLKEEADGSVYLVITNQDGTFTKTNVTSLIEDTVINSSNTISANSTSDSVNKKTTYTLEIKPNSITLSHLSTEAVSKMDAAINAAKSATEAKTSASASAISAQNDAIRADQAADRADVFAGNAGASAELAESYEVGASAGAQDAEAWAIGTIEGAPVGFNADQYNNNSKYYCQLAKQYKDETRQIALGDYKIPLFDIMEVTFLPENWLYDESIGLYTYDTLISSEHVTAQCVIDVNLDLSSLILAEDYGLKSVTESYDGGFIIYSESQPTETLSGTIIIQDGRDIYSIPENTLTSLDGEILTVEEE